MSHRNISMLLVCLPCTILPFACVEYNPSKGIDAAGDEDVGSVSQAIAYTDIGSIIGSPAVAGSTDALGSQFASACTPAANASDLTYFWTAPATGTYRFTTANSDASYDTVLRIANFNTPSVALACNDDAPGLGVKSAINILLTGGQKIFVTVDGYYSTSKGLFNLNISFGCPSGQACNDGNSCTTSDVCNASNSCGGTPIICTNSPGQCYTTTGSCSGSSCQYPPKPVGTQCDDGDSGTVDDVCDGYGGCAGSYVSECDPENFCIVESNFVYCSSGPVMQAFSISNNRWCIGRSVCNGNPVICPL